MTRLPDDRVAILGALDLERTPDGARCRPRSRVRGQVTYS